MWKWFKLEFKERFMNFETVEATYFLPVGLVGLYALQSGNFEYAFQIISAAVFGYWVLRGVYQLTINPVKRKVNLNKLVKARENVTS